MDLSTVQESSNILEENRIDQQTYQDLVDSKNLLEAVFNTSSLALHVLKSVRDTEGKIVDFDVVLTNAMSDKMAGRKVSGFRMLESWPQTKAIGIFERFVSTAETGIPMEYEYFYDGDGVRAWFRWVASKFNDGLYVTIEDITRRKINEETLQQTANNLQSIFDGVPAIVTLLKVVYDGNNTPVDFVISACNKATADFAGLTLDKMVGNKLASVFPEAFQGQIKESYLRVFSTGEPLHLEFFYPATEKWLSIVVTKQVDQQGLVIAAIDITENKKAEEEKKQNQLLTTMDKLKTEFFSNVSHEFRTPLTLILGPLEGLLKSPNVSELQVKQLQMVQRNAFRLQKLVTTLLDFSRIEAGRMEAIFQPTDLAEHTALLAGNFRSPIEAAGLKLVVECESMEPVYVNGDMWEKIVLNLLSNAYKFTFKGNIEVILTSVKKHAKLIVRDTGVGISQPNLPMIFDRFVRIESSRSRTHDGSGIGLALVKELVNIHGGTIKVKSKEGVGSEFIVSIPKGKSHLNPKKVFEYVQPLSTFNTSVYAQEALSWLPNQFNELDRRLTEKHPAKNTLPLGRKPNVLLVDDNADIREFIKKVLGSRYHVADANSGKKAMDFIAKGFKPDLILADVMMPEMNGYELLSEIKRNGNISSVPFIFLSARAAEENKIEGLRRGADDYLVKPFSAGELLTLIDSRIASHAFRTAIQSKLISDSRTLDGKFSQTLSELQISEQIIVKQKKLFNQVLDAAPQMIWICNSKGRVEFLNESWFKFTGTIQEQITSDQFVFDSFHPSFKSEAVAQWKSSLEQGRSYSGECMIRNSKGKYLWHLDVCFPVMNQEHETEMWIRAFTDVHELYRNDLRTGPAKKNQSREQRVNY